MTIHQIADKFYEYMQQGAFNNIYTELFAQDATSDEPPGSDWPKATGLSEIHAKGKKWSEGVEEMYGGTTGKPLITGDYFSTHMTMDFKPKGGERITMDEIGLYRVKDGKIVSEQFFY